jgi:phosphomannomutase
MSVKFGTSGLRGLGTDLINRNAAIFTRAFMLHMVGAGYVEPKSAVLLSRDFRQSSNAIAAECVRALASLGHGLVDCDRIPTPALALHALELAGSGKNVAALMITGSHIPEDRNGLKFYRPDGEIDKTDEIAIAGLAPQQRWPRDPDEAEMMGVLARSTIASENYLARNKAILKPNAFKKLKLGVYQHSSVARDMLVDVLRHYGAEVVALGRSAKFVAVDTEAVSDQTKRKLKKWTREDGLDAIVSADGDGDRPLVSDENGLPVRGDLLGLVCAEFLRARVVVTPVTSNSGIEASKECSVVRTRVGSPFVIAAMDAAVKSGKEAVMGFEANGGVLTATDFIVNGTVLKALPTRDSFLPILALLDKSARSGLPLSQVVTTYQLPFALSDRIEDFPVDVSGKLMKHLRASAQNLAEFLAPIGEPVATSDVDGLQVTLAGGRMIHFRPSGNAPEMRCYVEAPNKREAQSLMIRGLALLRGWTLAS